MEIDVRCSQYKRPDNETKTKDTDALCVRAWSHDQVYTSLEPLHCLTIIHHFYPNI